MTKKAFLDALKQKLSGLPLQEVEERLAFYNEMIDDRMEEGFSEEQAVSDMGLVDDIAEQIIADIPFSKIAKERIKPKRKMKAWEIVLLSLGSPLWLALGIIAFAVILALYVVLWSVVVSLWAVFVALVACAPSGVVIGVFYALNGSVLSGIVLGSVGLVCGGLSIFLFFGCRAVTKGILWLTKRIALGIKKCFVKKEGVS